jgi:bifunctional non-homologous end joining protein LigD
VAQRPSPTRAQRSLATYRRKRNIRRSSEPPGRPGRRRQRGLIFVVQKHAARSLHYDFRLEWAGTLKSWAVPKGPSTNPGDRRLAVQVEDHPITYAKFEGDIPEGEYGAGHVDRWDFGTWTPLSDPEEGLKHGKLDFELHGQRLQGRWHLVRTRAGERKPQWLLIKSRDTHANPEAAAATAQRAAARARLTNPQRVLFPEDGVTKLELATYLDAVADQMLPHLENRPLSVLRVVGGGAPFFQKHFVNESTEGLEVTTIRTDSGSGRYVICNSRAGLLELAQLGVVEVHTWGACKSKPYAADRLTLDLDPDPLLRWTRVRDAAAALRALLADLDLVSFVKTSGGKGLHVVVPLTAPLPDWGLAKELAHDIARLMTKVAPETFTAQAGAKNRRGRIFVDYLRNALGASTVAAYSPRWRPGVPVSMPLSWEELCDAKRAPLLTLQNVPVRLAETSGDPWKSYYRTRQALTRARHGRLRKLLAS